METSPAYEFSTANAILTYVVNPASLLLIAGTVLLCMHRFGGFKLPKWTLVLSWIGVALGAAFWIGIGFFALIFASEVNRGTWTSEERAAFEARTQYFFVYDAQGRDVMLSYLDGQPSSISEYIGPNSSRQKPLEPGETFKVFDEFGQPWVYPGPEADNDTVTGTAQ